MKLSAREKQIILAKRKGIRAIKRSVRITSYRKNSKPSRGEKRIIEFLVKEGVEFYREWFFPALVSPNSKNLLYFDFFIPSYSLCIEFDGQQHYSKDKTENQKLNDFAKNAYCLKNNLHLLRIKYDQFEDIEKLICSKIDKITNQ